MFGDNKSAVGRGFNDRETDVGEVGNAAPLVLAVAAGTLRAALNDVPGDCAGSDLVPIVRQPNQTHASAARVSGRCRWRGR